MLIKPTQPLERLAIFFFASLAAMLLPSYAAGQPDDGIEQIRAEQKALAERYSQLEAKLFSLHQFEKGNNPSRSKLLQQAFLQSQEKMTIAQLQQIVKLLADEDYKAAEKLQAQTLVSLTEMLKLLQAEDRSQKIRDDLDRYKAYAKEVDRLLRIQKGIRGQAEGGVDAKRLAKAESKAGERADKLAKTIESDNESESDSASGKQASSDGGDSNPSSAPDSPEENPDAKETGEQDDANSSDPKKNNDDEAKNGEQSDAGGEPKNGDSKPADGDSKPSDSANGESQPNESGSQSSPQESSGQQPPSPPSDPTPPNNDQPKDPVQQKIEAARQRMQQAQQDLKDAKRENAIEAMRDAEKELEAAKKELEEILRQLREEEIESKLKLLEERFRGMLEQQIRVNEATNKLLAVPEQARGTEFEISANRLSGDENQIAAAAGRALVLLKEDGSSIAFPITVEELQQDMLVVGKRLASAKINQTTVEIEADIVETLNELIAALVKSQEDLEEQKQQQEQQSPSQQQSGKPGEDPLVNKIAELKMLKSLQLRIHRRHERYSKFLDDPKDPTGVNEDPDVAAALQRLADRQAQLATITRQLVNEDNQ